MRYMQGSSQWLQDAVSQLMATFSGEDTSFVQVVSLLMELDRRAVNGDEDAAKAIACVRQFHRLIELAKRS